MADIHFNPKVALLVAESFEKIRINPGNFSDGRKTFEEMTYDDPKAFIAEREYMREVRVSKSVRLSCVKALERKCMRVMPKQSCGSQRQSWKSTNIVNFTTSSRRNSRRWWRSARI